MTPHMVCLAGEYRQIRRVVVQFVLVDVVDHFARLKWSTKHFRCDESMYMFVANPLVGIASVDPAPLHVTGP